jgi:hypothetical protein
MPSFATERGSGIPQTREKPTAPPMSMSLQEVGYSEGADVFPTRLPIPLAARQLH